MSEVMALWEDRISRRIRVCLPVEVLSYDNKAQTVTVKPQIQDTYLDQNGVVQAEVLQALSNVPVQFARGGKLRITFPVVANDTGIIVMADRSLDAWLTASSPTDTAPLDARRHNLSDAIYIPGVNVSGQAWTAADPDVITIGDDTQAGAFVARVGDPVAIALSDLQQFIFTAPSGTSGGPCTVSGAVVGTPATQISAGSATVKVLG